MPTFRLKYGRSTCEFDLEAERLTPRLPAIPDPPPRALVEAALDRPVDSSPFGARLAGVRRATLVVPDRTRYSAQEIIVPVLVDRLRAAGVPPERVSVLFATGTHRGHTPEERTRIVGSAVPAAVALVDHDGSDAAAMIDLGATAAGTPVRVHRLAVETDLLVLTATMNYHYLAGYGGGRKCFAPGVAAHGTCLELHRRTLDPTGRSLRHAACAPGLLSGNPFHEELLAACARAPKPPFLVQSLLTPAGEVFAVAAGDVRAAHEASIRPWDDVYRVPLERTADLVVASCGGAPKDLNLYQAHKAILHAARATRPGGVLVILAACEDGPGHPGFFRWFDHPTIEEHARAVRAEFAIPGQTAWSLRDLATRHRLYLISDLDPALTARTGARPARSVQDALEQARPYLPAHPFAIVLPDAGWVLPDPPAGR